MIVVHKVTTATKKRPSRPAKVNTVSSLSSSKGAKETIAKIVGLLKHAPAMIVVHKKLSTPATVLIAMSSQKKHARKTALNQSWSNRAKVKRARTNLRSRHAKRNTATNCSHLKTPATETTAMRRNALMMLAPRDKLAAMSP